MTTTSQNYYRRQLLRANVASFIASILDGARVPYALWGEQAADIFNDLEQNELQPRSLEYVIPDEALDTAIEALGFFEEHRLCRDPNCAWVQPHQDTPVPDAHFHTPRLNKIPVLTEKMNIQYILNGQDVIGIDTVSLFVKSKVLGWLPDFSLIAERPLRPDFRSFWLELNYMPRWLDEPCNMLPGMREKLILANELPPVECKYNGSPLYHTRELVDLDDLERWWKVTGCIQDPLTAVDHYMKQMLMRSFMSYCGK